MDLATLGIITRMLERSIIVVGGILSIFLGYKLFFLGIEQAQGEASAFGVHLKNFGPGLFFAALGAIILVTSMRAAITVNPGNELAPHISPQAPGTASNNPQSQTDSKASPIFFGIEDPLRQNNSWSPMAFFLETRQLLRRLEQNEPLEDLQDLRSGLTRKLESITMNEHEYSRFQELTSTVPLNETDQQELLRLEKKLFPYQDDINPS